MRVLSATDDSGNAGFDALYTGSSRDGLRVFFESAEQLAAGDTDVQVDVFERSGAAITRRSAGNGAFDATFAGTAGDGSHVLYETEEKVLAQDTDADVDVYDSAGTTALVSTGPTGGNGPVDAFFADVSEDGARAFFTTAESLVATDSDSVTDVYERAGGTTSVVSHGSGGGNGAVQRIVRGRIGGRRDSDLHDVRAARPRVTPTRWRTCTPPGPGADTRGRRARARCGSRSSPPTSPARRRTASTARRSHSAPARSHSSPHRT